MLTYGLQGLKIAVELGRPSYILILGLCVQHCLQRQVDDFGQLHSNQSALVEHTVAVYMIKDIRILMSVMLG